MIKFFMNRININEDIELTGASLDHISEIIADFLLQMRMENSSRLRVRLSMEEAMLRWMDHFGNGVPVHLEIGVILNRPTINSSIRWSPVKTIWENGPSRCLPASVFLQRMPTAEASISCSSR